MSPALPERDHLRTAAPAPARTCAVVVTWNAAEHIEACLTSVPDDVDVVIVDNASRDGTAEIVARAAPRARILRNATNVGFAAAVNQALDGLSAFEYVLLLNPDALLGASTVQALVSYSDAHEAVAVASARIVDASGRPERFAGGRDPTLLTVAVHELGLSRVFPTLSLYRPGEVLDTQDRDWVAGTCTLVRRNAIDLVGGLDEAYFLYAEDIDWCRRFREAGWRIVVVHGAVAVHSRSSSVNRAGQWVDAHRIGSLDRYFALRHGRASRLAFRVTRSLGAGCRAAVFTAMAWRRREIRDLARQRWRDARLALTQRHPE